LLHYAREYDDFLTILGIILKLEHPFFSSFKNKDKNGIIIYVKILIVLFKFKKKYVLKYKR